jgi:lipopolysaccharide transport protein LptA
MRMSMRPSRAELPPLGPTLQRLLRLAALAGLAAFTTAGTASSWAADIASGSAGGGPAGGKDACRDPVCLTAASLEADATHLTLHDFNIVYALRGTTVTGDLAQGDSPGRDSKDTHWVLTGHVVITLPQGRLKADRATMQIVNGRISNMTAQGGPAEFERGTDAAPAAGVSSGMQAALEHAHGHARQIVYDLDQNELELSGDSFLTNGCYEFTSEHMLYDIANQRVQADPHDSGGVHGKWSRNGTNGSAASCPGIGGGNKP